MSRAIVIAVAVLAVLFSSQNSRAEFIFAGRVTSVNDSLGLFPGVAIGNAVEGYFRYSANPSDWGFVGVSGEFRNFQVTTPATSVWDLKVSVSSISGTISNKDNNQPLHLFSVQLRDNPTTGALSDSLALLAYHGNIFQNAPVVTEVNLNFGSAGNDLFSGDVPPLQIMFGNASQHVGDFSFLVDTNGDGNRETRSFIRFDIDSLVAASVPEPGTIMLWASIGLIVLREGCRSISRKLHSPGGTHCRQG